MLHEFCLVYSEGEGRIYATSTGSFDLKPKEEFTKFIQLHGYILDIKNMIIFSIHLQFGSGSTFPVLVCTVSPGHWVNKADTQ